MGNLTRGLGVLLATMLATATTVWAQTADPPGRIGRLAFVNGTVSFHERDETNWAPAALNYPMTSGNALWTEPNGRAEVFVGGTRIRMQGSTQLETLALTDDQFQLRISQGRIDVKPVGLQQGQQIEVLTPRGSAMLIGDGDYMVEAGTTDDATRVGVRAGSARIVASNGSELVVHAGEIGVLTGSSPPQFETVRQATPPMPPEWATRDRQIVTTQSVQYVPTTMTGSEELDYYGSWSTVGDYGRVWSPRTVPTGWEPYRQGRWRWVEPWGWTWIDDQPWGFAPSHYGRWVNQGGRWYWVPPAREARPVYAPAVVGFVDIAGGAATLAIAASVGAPIGWFPLGPREVYVPPYTADRAYIRRVNAAYVRNEADTDRRIDYAERYRNGRVDDRRDDPRRPGAQPGPNNDRPTFVNQRFATVVPQQAFVRGDRVDRAAIRVDADRLARVQAAPVAAPIIATTAPPTQPGKAPDGKPGQPPAPAAKPGQPPAPAGAAVQQAPLANIPVLGRPEPQDRPTARAPGPQISRTQPAAPGATAAPADRQLPNLRTRDGREVERTAPSQAAPAAPPATSEPVKPGTPPVATPPVKPGEEPKAAEPPKPPQAPAAPPLATPKPGEQPKAAEPPKPPQAPAAPPVAAPKPPVTPPQAAEPPKPPQAPAAPPVAAPKPPMTPPQAAEPPKPPQAPVAPPVAAPKPPVTPPQAAEPPKAPVAPPVAAPKPPSPPVAPPVQQAKPPEPPRPAPQAAPPVQHPAPPPAPPPQQARPPAPPAPPPSQQAKPPAPPPQPQAKPPEQAKQPRERDDKGGDDRRR